MKTQRKVCLRYGLLAALLACGCDEAPPTQITRQEGPGSSANGTVTRSNAGQTGGGRRRTSLPAKKKEQPAPKIELTADTELFEVIENGSNVEVLRPASAVAGRDQVAAVLPPSGANASTFKIVERGQDATRKTDGVPNASFKLPPAFSVVAAAGYASEGLPWRIVRLGDGNEMVLVPAGESLQGKNGGSEETEPEFAVELNHFYIDVTEVTVRRYELYRDAIKRTGKRAPDEPANVSAPETHPVLGVNWGDARAYARASGCDLPTEAEWEKAARGQEGFDAPWGNGRAIWTQTRELLQIDAVKTFHTDVSPYGVFDLAGNAREWCADWYSSGAHREASRLNKRLLAVWRGPKRPSTANQRVVKGNGPNWAVWHRQGADMGVGHSNVGFRCAFRVPPFKD